MSYDKWARDRRARLEAKRLCNHCGGTREPGCQTKRCAACLQKNRKGTRTQTERRAKYEAQLARIAETSATMIPTEQAADMGIRLSRVYILRNKARASGRQVHSLVRGGNGRPAAFEESAKFRALDGAPACDRCGLRGPHECLDRAEAFTSRRGPGRVYPSTFAEPKKRNAS